MILPSFPQLRLALLVCRLPCRDREECDWLLKNFDLRAAARTEETRRRHGDCLGLPERYPQSSIFGVFSPIKTIKNPSFLAARKIFWGPPVMVKNVKTRQDFTIGPHETNHGCRLFKVFPFQPMPEKWGDDPLLCSSRSPQGIRVSKSPGERESDPCQDGPVGHVRGLSLWALRRNQVGSLKTAAALWAE